MIKYDIRTGITKIKTKTAVAISAAVLTASGLGFAIAIPAISHAAPGDNGSGYGGCVDNFYGNATNPRPSGHGVLPSQSPGPWVNNPSDPSNPTPGPSVGDVMQVTTAAGLNGKQTMDIICHFP